MNRKPSFPTGVFYFALPIALIGFATLGLLLSTASTLAQAPFDPLQRPDEKRGSYSYKLSLDYTPIGSQGVSMDEKGTPYTFTRFTQGFRLSISGECNLRETFVLTASLSPSLSVRQEDRLYPDRSAIVQETNTSHVASLGFRYRFRPKNSLDPQYALSLAYPWAIATELSANILRDPVVLSASLGYMKPMDGNIGSISLGFGAGFVANETITFSGSVQYALPVGRPELPSTSVTLRTGYSLNGDGNRELSIKSTLVVRGHRTWVGLGLEWGGRGL